MTIQKCIENFNNYLDEYIYFLIGEDTLDRYKLYVKNDNNIAVDSFKWSNRDKCFDRNRYEMNIIPFFKNTNKWVEAHNVKKLLNDEFVFTKSIHFLGTFKEKYLYSKVEKRILNRKFDICEIKNFSLF